MGKSLRVLHIEDRWQDAELIEAQLEAEGIACEIHRIETRDAFEAELDTHAYDLILSDYSLPGFDGLTALGIARERQPDVPFIFVTGTLGESTVVETLQRGATDYILKDSLTRLPAAVRRARQEAVAREQREQTEVLLADSERRFGALIENSPDAISLVDRYGCLLFSSQANSRLWGYSLEEFSNLEGLSQVHPEDRALVQARFLELSQTPGGLAVTEYRMRHQDGSWHWVEATGQNLLHIPNVGAIVFNTRDITDRKQTERALRESEERFRAQYKGNPIAVFTWQRQGEDFVLTDYNEAALALSQDQAARILGKHAGAFYAGSPGILDALRRCWAEQAMIRLEVSHTLNVTGDTRHYLVHFVPIPPELVLLHVEDLTERRALEDQLRQSQKMEAVGQLAGGVAHDFNNLLTVIIGYTEMLLGQDGDPDSRRRYLQEVQNAGEQAAALTQQLLAFSRRQVLQPQTLDLNAVVSQIDSLLQRLIGEHIELRTVLDPSLDSVAADPGQLQQVIMNLAVNARDAMPKGGTLTIETANVELVEPYVGLHLGTTPGGYVLLAVSDTGHGMDKQTQSRIFEPFFTTKEQGKGTGLGLSTVFGIVQQSGGSVQVYSEPGIGTSFKVYLPRNSAPGAVEGEVRESRSLPIGSETILLVEDDPQVLGLARIALQDGGYRLIEASGGEEALSLALEYPGPIDLLLTDVVMPQMSGRELMERLVNSRPEMKVLFMSGYTDDAIVHDGILSPEVAFIGKPFTPVNLTRKVRATLDALKSS